MSLLIMLLVVLAIVYAVFFGIFKLIWIIFKKERNFWPLVLAGVSTVGFAALIVGGTWWAAHKIIRPFTPIITSVQNNPTKVFGPWDYRDNTYPFELTVFDGMAFSDWMHFSPVALKLGLDTNAFKKPTDENANFWGIVLAVNSKSDEKEPFKPLQEALSSKDRRLKITYQESTVINGLPAYKAEGIAYSNRGPLNAWVAAYHTAPTEVTYVAVISSSENEAEKATTVLNSFHLIAAE